MALHWKRYEAADTLYNADDIAWLANTPAQAKFLLHSLEKAAGGIGFHVNVNKTKYTCFNQSQMRDISTLIG